MLDNCGEKVPEGLERLRFKDEQKGDVSSSGYDYYLHKNRHPIDNYWGRIGQPFKVCAFKYYIWKLFRFKVTKVPKGTTQTEVIVAAAINGGAHPNSWKVQNIRKTGHDEDSMNKEAYKP